MSKQKPKDKEWICSSCGQEKETLYFHFIDKRQFQLCTNCKKKVTQAEKQSNVCIKGEK